MKYFLKIYQSPSRLPSVMTLALLPTLSPSSELRLTDHCVRCNRHSFIPGHIHSMFRRRVKCSRCPFRLTRWWARAYPVTRVKSRRSRTARWCARSQCLRPPNTFTPEGRAASRCGTSASPVKHQSVNWIVWWVGNCRRFMILWYFYFGL